MNRRQKKKFEKKLGCKKYIDYRNIMITKICAEYAKEHQIEDYIIYVIDSRKMNGKHPVSVQILLNPQPGYTSSGNDLVNEVDQTNFMITFKSYTDEILDDQINEMLRTREDKINEI